VDSRRGFEHGEEVESDVNDAGEADDGAADVKNGVVAAQKLSVCDLPEFVVRAVVGGRGDTHLSMSTPRRR
jgi:predicted RNA-binding protein with TRAM domain